MGERNSNYRMSLRNLLTEKKPLRFMEAHNGISALIVENTKIQQGEKQVEFDGIWISGLTESAAKGIPDAELIGPDGRCICLEEIVNVTTKPLIVDGDTGGTPAQFQYFAKKLERLGVSAVIVEDKRFPKLNSLDPDSVQNLEDVRQFSQKIRLGKQSVLDQFIIIARLESLNVGTGMQDAINRARSYMEAGCDGIMIHSRSPAADEVLSFAKEYDRVCNDLRRRPALVCVPTTYNEITDEDLGKAGFDIVIHANQMLRSSYKAMKECAETILLSDRGLEVEALCSPVSDIFRTVGFYKLRDQDEEAARLRNLSVIIPAAGIDPIFPNCPKSLIRISGKTILDYQMENLKGVGLKNIVLVRGHEGSQFKRNDLILLDNHEYATKHILHSVFVAREYMKNGFMLILSDILFNTEIIRKLIECDADIVLVVDNSYRFHKDVPKNLDLVVSRQKRSASLRTLSPTRMIEVRGIGRKIMKELADHEFVGIAYFSENVAQALLKIHDECEKTVKGRFHEAVSFEKADMTDYIQELIDRGFTVNGLEVFKGWMEIHSQEDVQLAEMELLEKKGVT
jgi:phosphoenolpyruvate phosphomutase